jgi:hypothetical protein
MHPYPKVDVQVSSTTKLAVADLECHSHGVIAVKVLVEAFPSMGRELDVMSCGGTEQAG